MGRHQLRGRRARVIISTTIFSTLSATSAALSLADFAPYCTSLSPSCQAIYTTPIACSNADFERISNPNAPPCSDSCIKAIIAIGKDVNTECKDPEDQQNLIGQFLGGNGLVVLCPGAVALAPQSSTLVPAQSSRTQSSTSGLIVDTSVSPVPSSASKTSTNGMLPSTSTGSTSTPSTTSSSLPSSTSLAITTANVAGTSGTPAVSINLPTSETTSMLPSSVVTSSTPTSDQMRASYSACLEKISNPFNACDQYNSGARIFAGSLLTGLGWVILGVVFI